MKESGGARSGGATCPQNVSLLALHAGSDAPPEEAAGLRRHLASCADCRRVLAEFRATRQWVRLNLEPAVDAATLTELRRRVTRRLSRERPLPWLVALAGRAVSSWRTSSSSWAWPQPLRGFGVAALLLVGAMGALSGLDHRRSEPGAWTPVPSAAWPNLTEEAGEQSSSLDESEDPASETEEPETDPIAELEPPTIDDLSPLPSGLRIEMHTPDPNVRIIWFASNTASSVDTPRQGR